MIQLVAIFIFLFFYIFIRILLLFLGLILSVINYIYYYIRINGYEFLFLNRIVNWYSFTYPQIFSLVELIIKTSIEKIRENYNLLSDKKQLLIKIIILSLFYYLLIKLVILVLFYI